MTEKDVLKDISICLGDQCVGCSLDGEHDCREQLLSRAKTIIELQQALIEGMEAELDKAKAGVRTVHTIIIHPDRDAPEIRIGK